VSAELPIAMTELKFDRVPNCRGEVRSSDSRWR